MRMTARCRVTVILALLAVLAAVAMATADEKTDDGKVSEPPQEKAESGSKADVSYKSDSPPKEKQYFLYYNPRAQERNAQIVGADNQG